MNTKCFFFAQWPIWILLTSYHIIGIYANCMKIESDCVAVLFKTARFQFLSHNLPQWIVERGNQRQSINNTINMLYKYSVDQIPPPSSPSPCLPLRSDQAHQLTNFNQMKISTLLLLGFASLGAGVAWKSPRCFKVWRNVHNLVINMMDVRATSQVTCWIYIFNIFKSTKHFWPGVVRTIISVYH